LLQFLLLLTFLAIFLANGPRIDPNAAVLILAGMMGVSAMAVQNVVTRISIVGAPATAVVTGNVTLLAIDVGEILFGRDPRVAIKARQRAKHTWLAVVGFVLGCALGAACESAFGLRSPVLPAGIALVALAIGGAGAHPNERRAA
jgi:uncharacterized membrane protein YoaK (UPF0700 family)